MVQQNLIPIVTNPSSVADIVGYSVRLARENARMLIKILLWPSLVELLGKIVTLMGINALITAGPGNMFIVAGGLLTCAIGGSVALAAEFFLTMRQLALLRMFTGFESDFQDAYKFVWKKKFQLLAVVAGSYVLFFIAIFTWSVQIGLSIAFMTNKNFAIFAFASACWGILFLMLFMFWSMLPVVLLAPALVIENRPFSRLISWTMKMAFKSLVRSTYFLLLLGIALFLLSSVLNIPPSIFSMIELSTNYLGPHASAKAPNLYGQIFASVWRSVANMVISPIAFFGIGFYYLDLRMRTDGYDISRRLELMSKKSR